MDDFFYVLGLAASFAFGLLLKSFLPSYFSEKGKNLATKEDIQEITQIVERVKTDLSKDLEVVKWELGKKAILHQLVAEREIAAIAEIGKSLFELKAATHNLRPIVDRGREEGETKEDVYNRRYSHWVEKHNIFLTDIEKHKLFLPKDIFEEFEEVRRLAAKEALSFEMSISDDERLGSEIRKEAMENLKILKESINRASKMIHKRYEIAGLSIDHN